MKFTRNEDLKKKRWLKIKGENEKNAWANAFNMINQSLDQKYKENEISDRKLNTKSYEKMKL
jgi:hypothetical protein